jgi:tyrosyl-tRNA synthetase
MDYLIFLRKVGKYITVNNMMHKETVKRRLETEDQSISYTEFSYMLIQGYDFVRLFDDHDCKLQIAGSDQRGNVVTGIELINKISEKEEKDAYGATTPLILDSTGKKFGKSEGNALWLSAEKNTPYTIYQYFINVTDEDVERYLKIFSVKTLEDIEQIVKTHHEAPEKRYGQTQLAYIVTQIIFGTKTADQCELIRNTIYGE